MAGLYAPNILGSSNTKLITDSVDVCSLVLTSAFFIGVIIGTALIAQKCQALIDATKASLEERGWVISPSSSSASREGGRRGSTSVVLVKTSKKKMDYERYLDATQRGVVKAFNAATFGRSNQNQNQNQTAPALQAAQQQQASTSASISASAPGPSSVRFLGSTFTQVRSQMQAELLPRLPASQSSQSGLPGGSASGTPDDHGQLSGRDPAAPPGRATSSSSGDDRGSTTTRDSFYEMTGRLSAWPSGKIEKVKRLRDQYLPKV